MTFKPAILTPTRGRPGRLDTFVASVFSTATIPVFMFNYIDSDDPRIIAYRDYEQCYEKGHIINIYGEPKSVSQSWNDLAKKAIEHGCDPLIMGNDDLVYRTKDWNNILRRKIEPYKDQIYCAWFEDKINGPNHCAFPIVSKKWVDTLGYFTPGIFNFGYNDTWVFDIAKRIDRTVFIPDVVAEHMHFTAGKSAMDETYHHNRTRERGNLYEKDRVIFENTVGDREAAAKKLREQISEWQRQKDYDGTMFYTQ